MKKIYCLAGILFLSFSTGFAQSITPTFNEIISINNANASYSLPTKSNEGITGTWSPATLIEGDHTYTFTPNSSNAMMVTKNYLYLKQQPTNANEDDFSSTPIIEGNGADQNFNYYTPSVFNNDSVNNGAVVSSNNVTYSILSISPDNWDKNDYYYPTMTSDGRIKIHRGFTDGNYQFTYKITSKSCSASYDTAVATVVLGNQTTSKMAKKPKLLSQSIVMYPNPSNGVYTFDLRGVESDYNTIKVYNLLGAEVYQDKITSKSMNKIDISNLTSGSYIAKLSGNSGTTSLHLIKQ